MCYAIAIELTAPQKSDFSKKIGLLVPTDRPKPSET
jgi:hypothetical protein